MHPDTPDHDTGLIPIAAAVTPALSDYVGVFVNHPQADFFVKAFAAIALGYLAERARAAARLHAEEAKREREARGEAEPASWWSTLAVRLAVPSRWSELAGAAFAKLATRQGILLLLTLWPTVLALMGLPTGAAEEAIRIYKSLAMGMP